MLFYFDWFAFKKGKYELTEITSDAPLQTFQQGEELKFRVNGTGKAHTDIPVNYEVLDYNSHTIEAGNAVIKKDSSSCEITLENKPNGAYQIIASYEGQSVVQYFLVLVNMDKRTPVDDSPFALDALPYGMAMDINAALLEDFCDVLALSGVSWIRDRIYFDNYTTKSGNTWNFTMPIAERSGKYLNNKGVKVSMAFDLPPAILRGPNVCPVDLYSVYTFGKQLAEKYDGSVNCWELMNEVCLGGGMSNRCGPDLYAAAFKAFALGVQDSDTKNEVFVSPFGAAAAPSHTGRFVEFLYRNEIYKYTDILNYHMHRGASGPYDSYYPSEKMSGDAPNRTAENMQMRQQFGVDNVAWDGESGMSIAVPMDEDYNMEEQMVQAKFLITSFVEDIAMGVTKKFFFDGLNYQEGGRAWGMTSRSKSSPSAYAAYASLAAMTYALGEGVYVNKVSDVPEMVTAEVFSDRGDTVIAFYSREPDGTKIPVSFNMGKTNAVLIDMFGNEANVSSDTGIYSLVAEEKPQFLRIEGTIDTGIVSEEPIMPRRYLPEEQMKSTDADRVVLQQIHNDTQADGTRLAGYKYEEDTNEVTVDVWNFNNYPVSGKVIANSQNGWEITPSEQEIYVDAMGKTELKFEIIPDGFTSTQDIISYYAELDCGTTSTSVIYASAKKVVTAYPLIENGQKNIVLNFENRSNKEKVIDKIVITVNGVTESYTNNDAIEAKGSLEIKLPADYSENEQVMKLEVKGTFKDGTVCDFSDEINYLIIPNKIDTEKVPNIIIPDDCNVVNNMYYGKEDLYGRMWLAADKDNLYMTIIAQDDVHSAYASGVSIWNNDGIQFSIAQGQPALGIPYYELGASLLDSGKSQFWCWNDSFGNGKAGEVFWNNSKISRDESTLTTTYEIVIPWEEIKPVSFADGKMAFSFLINENEGMVREGYIEWGSGIGNTKNSSLFRTILFSR